MLGARFIVSFAMATISTLSKTYQSAIYSALYRKSDSNSDGSVSSTELTSSLSTIKTALGDSTLDSSDLFETMDSDSDGEVSKDEYKEGLAATVAASDTTTSGTSKTRQEVIDSYLKGVKASMVSTLLGTKDDSSYSSLSDLVSVLRTQSGQTSTYSATGSSYSSNLIGVLFNTSA